MAIPIDPEVAKDLLYKKEIKYYCIVEFDGKEYTIWADEKGPAYSTPTTSFDHRHNGIDYISLDNTLDTVTHRVMQDKTHVYDYT